MYSPFFVGRTQSGTEDTGKKDNNAAPGCFFQCGHCLWFGFWQLNTEPSRIFDSLQFHLTWKIIPTRMATATARHPYGDYPYSQEQVQLQLALSGLVWVHNFYPFWTNRSSDSATSYMLMSRVYLRPYCQLVDTCWSLIVWPVSWQPWVWLRRLGNASRVLKRRASQG